MANIELAVRFTEDKYASKTDLIKDLKTTLVDNFWKNILEYRKSYFVSTSLHTFNGNEYLLCDSEMTKLKNKSCENKLIKIMEDMNKINEEDYSKFEYQNYASLLKNVAEANKLDDSDTRIRAILKKEIRYLDFDNIVLPRYIACLEYLKRHFSDNIDVDFIMKLNALLIGKEEGSFRTLEDDDPANKVLIDRIYTAAPVNMIEHLTEEVCRFINMSELSSLYKAFIAYYALCIIKPFAKYSREVALLVAKAIIAREAMGEVALLLPIERLLTISKEDENKLFTDVQKYNDTTYFVRYALDVMDNLSGDFIDKIYLFSSSSIHEEFYAPDEEEKVEEPVKIEESNKAELPKEEKPREEKKPKKREVKVEERIVEGEVAIRYIPKGLDEKEAAKLEVQLLEMDPSLKKKEAHFYAHHCTLGMNYTIQHYKRYNRVSYETARTSMDHLAELGYYRKEQIKNKFIYSPIKRD